MRPFHMESLSYDNFISLIYVFVSWILVLFLITAKTKNRLSNLILASFLLVDAQDSSGLFAHFFLYPMYPDLGMLLNSTVFLKMPLLYLYLQSVIYSDFKLSKRHLWHLLPFVFDFLIFIPNYYSQDFEVKKAFLSITDYYQILEIRISYITIHLQIFVYGVLSFLLIIRYKKLLLENFSNAKLLNYKWLFQLVSIIMLIALIATFKNIFKFSHSEMAYDYTYLAVNLLGLIFIAWLVIKALHTPELFRGIKSDLQLVKSVIPKQNCDLNNVDNEIENHEIQSLRTFMIKQKPYLNPSLNIDELASQINIASRDLSILINNHLNQHFFDFVNGYRIKNAMEILRNSDKKNVTILEVLYDVGFNSKSSFNTAFKKYTGKTPTEYRKMHLLSDG
nr:helix-turn-helix transcriptional regulator [uncultured Carboxylicivirga sp.]